MIGRVKEAPLGSIKTKLTSQEVLKLKFMQIYHKNIDETENKTSFDQEKLSINDIAALDPNLINGKVFELNLNKLEHDQKGAEFTYAHIKVNKIKKSKDSEDSRIMIQIIDIKDKMLYNEVKAEKKYLTLMNATVSHELRNPLNSLVSGIENMQSYYDNLRQILKYLSNNLHKNVQKVVYERLELVCEGLETNSTKITSSAKFVDYFVHDMLDYTILTNESSKFIKIISKFDIRNAIKEIYEILEDKARLK